MLSSADTPTVPDTAATARQTGFVQCLGTLRRTLITTPVGWGLVVWMSWDRAPHSQIYLWLGLFAGVWAFSLWLLGRVARRGPQLGRDAGVLLAVAAMDGAAWGAVVGLLMGFDRVLDPWLGAVLCGVSAVNAPVYITYVQAYRAQIGAMWVTVVVGSVLLAGPGTVPLEGTFGLTVFLALLIYYMNPIAQRVVEGIRLQLANAQLAEQLREALALVEQDAATDTLTGQPNRRALDILLAQQVEVSGRPGQPLSVLMLDIDHFKRINDTHGHGIGDDALRAFARRVRGLLREGDVCARYGGEEFVVVLPGTALPVALEVAERLRSAMAETPLLKVPLLPVTVSIGAAEFGAGQTAAALLEAADQAVYAAKRGGRNQVQPTRGASAAVQPGAAVPAADGAASASVKEPFNAPTRRR